MSDRLSPLLKRFELHSPLASYGLLHQELAIQPHGTAGHLHLLRRGTLRLAGPQRHRRLIREPSRVYVARPLAHRLAPASAEGAEIVTAAIHFGADDENPLLHGLPALLQVPMAGPCGHAAVVGRLAEVLVIPLLRHAMAERLVDAGVMAGLGDARLARAISALHADLAKGWTVEAMASVAGRSRARFSACFMQTVGAPPGEYLTRWRMGLARRLLRRGRPVKQVAAEVGYASTGAFGRVFLQPVGATPRAWQRAAATAAA